MARGHLPGGDELCVRVSRWLGMARLAAAIPRHPARLISVAEGGAPRHQSRNGVLTKSEMPYTVRSVRIAHTLGQGAW